MEGDADESSLNLRRPQRQGQPKSPVEAANLLQQPQPPSAALTAAASTPELNLTPSSPAFRYRHQFKSNRSRRKGKGGKAPLARPAL